MFPSVQLNRKLNIFFDLLSRLSHAGTSSLCLAFLRQLQAAKTMRSVLVVSSDLRRYRVCPQSDVAPVNKPLDYVNHNRMNRAVWLSPDLRLEDGENLKRRVSLSPSLLSFSLFVCLICSLQCNWLN